MRQHLILDELKEEWRMSATRHKVGIVVLALVIFGVMLFAPAAQKMPPYRGGSIIIPLQTHFDRKPFLATDSCAIFEFSQESPGPVCDAATIVEGRP